MEAGTLALMATQLAKVTRTDWRMTTARDAIFRKEITDIDWQIGQLQKVKDEALVQVVEFIVANECGSRQKGGRPLSSMQTVVAKVQKAREAGASSASASTRSPMDSLAEQMSEATI